MHLQVFSFSAEKVEMIYRTDQLIDEDRYSSFRPDLCRIGFFIAKKQNNDHQSHFNRNAIELPYEKKEKQNLKPSR
jgi:hypothetical protein